MNSESNAIVFLILILIIGFLVFVFLGKGNNSTTVSPDETSSGQTTTDTTNPGDTGTNEDIPEEVQPGISNRPIEDLIVVTSPVPYQEITSPLIIEGKARGFWFFEGDFPVMLSDSRGEIIARGQANAKSNWMTNDFVQFSTALKFTPDYEKSGVVIIRNNNPSDLAENNRELKIPVAFKGQDTITVKVFFSNVKLDPDFSSGKAYAAQRVIPKTQAVARAAMEELLKGPTEREKEAGFFTSINPGVKIQRLSITNGVARVDFDKQMEYQVGGSARVAAIRAEVTQTLKQFSTVKEVIISIDGRTEDILQP